MAGYQTSMDEFIEPRKIQTNAEYLKKMRGLGFEFYNNIEVTPDGLRPARSLK